MWGVNLTCDEPKKTELNTRICNLESDLLAGEGGWVTNRLRVDPWDKVKRMGQNMAVSPIIYTQQI